MMTREERAYAALSFIRIAEEEDRMKLLLDLENATICDLAVSFS